MGPAHRAAAAPLGVGVMFSVPWGDARPFAELVGQWWLFSWLPDTALRYVVLGVWVLTELVVHAALGLVVVGVSKWNDLDHPRFKGKLHPGAWLVRLTAQIGYAIRMRRDKFRADLHRGPSHCLEWCLLAGLAAGYLTSRLPPLAPWWPWWGLAVFLGTASHVLLDAMTPAGVPISALYNAWQYHEVWRRHAYTWKWSAVPVWAPCVLAEVTPWPGLAAGVAGVAAGPVPVAAGGSTLAADLVDDLPDEETGPQPIGPVGLLTYVFTPGMRASTRLRFGWHRFVVPVPRVGVMAVDEKTTSDCDPGLVKTDSGAEHMLVIPFLWGVTVTVLLAGIGWLGPIVWWLTS